MVAQNIIDYFIVGLAGSTAFICFLGAYKAVPRGDEGFAARSFGKLWRNRFSLLFTGAVLALAQVLPLQWFYKDLGSGLSWGCDLYLIATLGGLEPLFLLLALFFIVHGVRTEDVEVALFQRTIRQSLRWAAIPLLVQLILQVAGRIARNPDVVGVHSLLLGHKEQLLCGVDESGCTACVFPILSIALSILFALAFVLALRLAINRLGSSILNQTLLGRLASFQRLLAFLLAVQLLLQACTLTVEAGEWPFRMLHAAHTVIIVLVIVTVSNTLIVQPLKDMAHADMSLCEHRPEAQLHPQRSGTPTSRPPFTSPPPHKPKPRNPKPCQPKSQATSKLKPAQPSKAKGYGLGYGFSKSSRPKPIRSSSEGQQHQQSLWSLGSETVLLDQNRANSAHVDVMRSGSVRGSTSQRPLGVVEMGLGKEGGRQLSPDAGPGFQEGVTLSLQASYLKASSNGKGSRV